MLANTSVVQIDLEIEEHLESPVDQETVDHEKLDLHNDTLGTYTWSFTSI